MVMIWKEVGRFRIYLGGRVDRACQEVLMGTGIPGSSKRTYTPPHPGVCVGGIPGVLEPGPKLRC